MVTPLWEEPFLSCLIGGASIHQQRLKVLSEPCWIVTHHTALKPNLWWIPGDTVKALDPPYFEMLLPADQAATLLVIGLAFSRYRSVRISQVPSVASLRWSSLIFPNVQSCSGLRKEHQPSALNE